VLGTALLALAATGAFLVKDLDRPDRFLNVLLRPQKRSWLVLGGYGITIYGGLLTLFAGLQWLGLSSIASVVMYLNAAVALFVAVYTAFLFAQAKGRDFWQSPTLVLHMLVHSVMAGAAALAVIGLLLGVGTEWQAFLSVVLLAGIGANLLTVFVEMAVPHPTADAKAVADMILKGRYRNRFWLGTVLLGNVLPAVVLLAAGTTPLLLTAAGALVLTGIYLTERIWVEAPQRIALV
jgi:formate-dependent nitrite reductase membrane component NrfD